MGASSHVNYAWNSLFSFTKLYATCEKVAFVPVLPFRHTVQCPSPLFDSQIPQPQLFALVNVQNGTIYPLHLFSLPLLPHPLLICLIHHSLSFFCLGQMFPLVSRTFFTPLSQGGIEDGAASSVFGATTSADLFETSSPPRCWYIA